MQILAGTLVAALAPVSAPAPSRVLATAAMTVEKPPAPAGPPEKVFSLVTERMRGHDPALPERVAQAVLAESALAGLDPLLVLALIHVESTFDPDAKSNHGAVGLMQLKKPTMRAVRARAGLPEADPCDPVANVEAGVRYLGQMRDSFHALDTALMAYNAGPTRIRGLLRDGQIPEHFHAYPLRVKQEMAKLAP